MIPALPVDGTGAIVRDVTISAMFNAGNILEDSYKEDFLDYGDSTQDIIANVIYKEEGAVGMEMFPRNTSVTVSLVGVTEASAVRKTFDLSQFVTTRKQALHYGMLMCQQRRHIKRSVEFKTFPSEAPVTPGSYIYVQVDENRWDSLSSGMVEAGNVLNSPISEGTINGTYRILLYDGTSQVTSFSSITVTNGVASGLGGGYTGWLYVLGSEVTSKRVFRVVEVELAEEGEITVRAIEHPCQESVVGGVVKTLSLIARQDVGLYTIRNAKLKLAGSDVAKVRDWSLETSVNLLDTTALGDTANTYTVGLQSATGSATLSYYTATSGNEVTNLLEKIAKAGAVTDSDKVSLTFEVGTNQSFTGNAFINSASISTSTDEITTASFNFTIDGPLTAVTLTGT